MNKKLKIHDGDTLGKTFEVKLEYPKPKVATMSKDITITNASYPGSFVCFDIKGLKDGIIVGTYGKADENGIPVGLAIGYKGEQVMVPFKATSDEIKKINKGGDNE